jgi:hypothetical protein
VWIEQRHQKKHGTPVQFLYFEGAKCKREERGVEFKIQSPEAETGRSLHISPALGPVWAGSLYVLLTQNRKKL